MTSIELRTNFWPSKSGARRVSANSQSRRPSCSSTSAPTSAPWNDGWPRTDRIGLVQLVDRRDRLARQALRHRRPLHGRRGDDARAGGCEQHAGHDGEDQRYGDRGRVHATRAAAAGPRAARTARARPGRGPGGQAHRERAAEHQQRASDVVPAEPGRLRGQVGRGAVRCPRRDLAPGGREQPRVAAGEQRVPRRRPGACSRSPPRPGRARASRAVVATAVASMTPNPIAPVVTKDPPRAATIPATTRLRRQADAGQDHRRTGAGPGGPGQRQHHRDQEADQQPPPDREVEHGAGDLRMSSTVRRTWSCAAGRAAYRPGPRRTPAAGSGRGRPPRRRTAGRASSGRRRPARPPRCRRGPRHAGRRRRAAPSRGSGGLGGGSSGRRSPAPRGRGPARRQVRRAGWSCGAPPARR